MKRFAFLFAASILVGCDRAPDAPAPAPATTQPAPSPGPAPAAAPASVRRATATGVVQSIDATAKKISIAHDPVDALGWPAMTMNFDAPATDLSTLAPGDAVVFEFDSSGMDGTIVSITKR